MDQNVLPHRPDIDPHQIMTVSIEAQHWNVVIAGLQELKLGLSGPVFSMITGQLEAQMLAMRDNEFSEEKAVAEMLRDAGVDNALETPSPDLAKTPKGGRRLRAA